MNNTKENWPTPEFISPLSERLTKLLGSLATANQVEIVHNPEGEMSESFQKILAATYPGEAGYGTIDTGNRPSQSIADIEEVVLLPVAGFISAPGFVNWQDGRGDNPKNGSSSKLRIKNYSKRTGETASPIQQVVVVHLTDDVGGDQYRFQLYGDGAHRLGAAVRRGDEYIRVSGGVSLVEMGNKGE